MVSLGALWLPIVLSAVAVFVASSVIHMVLTLHRADYKKLPNEDRVQDVLRGDNLAVGTYVFPHAEGMAGMKDPAFQEKFKRGPVGHMTILRGGSPAMGMMLGQWFVFSLVAGVFAAYVAGRTLGPGAEYLEVFRVAGTTAFLAYSGSEATKSIWFGQLWSVTARHWVDGIIYALLTAGFFGWLWPSM